MLAGISEVLGVLVDIAEVPVDEGEYSVVLEDEAEDSAVLVDEVGGSTMLMGGCLLGWLGAICTTESTTGSY